MHHSIKCIQTSKFQVNLEETESGRYVVTSKREKDGPLVSQSLPIVDYHLASFVFDRKVEEMEGN